MIRYLFNNRYYLPFTVVMIAFFVAGVVMGWNGDAWGLVPFVLGGLMASRIEILKASPRQVGIIAAFGEKKNIMVEGAVIIFNPFGLKVLDVVVIEMRQKEMSFPVKNLNCSGGGVLEGEISISVIADKSDVKRLHQFDDVGQMEGLEKQLGGVAQSSLQRIGSVRESPFMITRSDLISKDLKLIMMGEQSSLGADTTEMDDAQGFGIIIKKVEVRLNEAKSVIEAKQRRAVTVTINERIETRLQFLLTKGLLVVDINPTLIEEIRKNLMEEDRNADKLIQENRGGRNVNVSNRGPATP